MSAKELTSTVYLVLEPTYTRYSPKKLEGFKVLSWHLFCYG